MLAVFKEELLDTRAWKLVPQWVKFYVEGYRAAMSEQTWQNDLVWRVYLDGEYIDSDAVPDGRWQDVDGGCHFWKNNGKPFGEIRENERSAS
jgi:hypothetical protein